MKGLSIFREGLSRHHWAGRLIRAASAAALSLCLFAGAGGATARAAEEGLSFSLPVCQIFNASGNTDKADGSFTYRLTPEDSESPMPAGSTAQGYEVTLSGTAETRLDFHYDHAGIWRYTMGLVSERADGAYTLDTTVYTIDIAVKNTDDGGLAAEAIVSDGSGKKMDALTFTQAYKGPAPVQPGNPIVNVATGIVNHPQATFAVLGALCLAMIVALGRRLKSEA